MFIKKITTGFVVQTFDTDIKTWISQEFIAGEVEYEDEVGKPVDFFLTQGPDGSEPYLPFDMKQPLED